MEDNTDTLLVVLIVVFLTALVVAFMLGYAAGVNAVLEVMP